MFITLFRNTSILQNLPEQSPFSGISILIFEREGLDVVDIGFSVLERFEGKGLMFEAAHKVKSIGMDEFGLKKISAITTKGNFSSQKLIERLGLKFQKMVTIPEDSEELMYYETE